MSSKSPSTPENLTASVSIRRLGGEDLAAVKRLAQLDTRPLPSGELLGAEVEGRLLAAISLATGESVADPFSRTDELRAMLELRAEQLRGRARDPGLHAPRLPRVRARLGLAGSRPGVPRWLMDLAER